MKKDVKDLEWVDIDVLNGFTVTGFAKYCVNVNELTIVLDGILTPAVKAKSAILVGKLPEILISSVEVREVTLLSNGNVANIVITSEGNILFESYIDVEKEALFSAYKTYLIN